MHALKFAEFCKIFKSGSDNLKSAINVYRAQIKVQYSVDPHDEICATVLRCQAPKDSHKIHTEHVGVYAASSLHRLLSSYMDRVKQPSCSARSLVAVRQRGGPVV